MVLKVLVAFLISILVISLLQANVFAQTQQEQNYYVYVDPVPDYASSYASNVIYDATKSWEDVNPGLHFYKAASPQQSDLYIQWIRDYGSSIAGETITGRVIQIGLGDSNCLKRWEPYSTFTVTHIAQHEIGHFLGHDHSSDPNNIMYHSTLIQYGLIEIENNLAAGYAWFVPACTTRSVTSFTYGVKTSDTNYGLDVYFVPSKDEFDKFSKGQQFQYYSDKGCSAKNYLSFGDTCNGVANGSGLLIVMAPQLSQPLATISVQLVEQATVGSTQSSNPVSPSQPNPQPPSPFPTPVTGFVKVDKTQYAISVGQPTQVTVYGKLDSPQGGKVILTVTKPDGTSEVLQALVTSSGDFSTPIILDKYSTEGQYQVYANYQGSDFSSISFNVVSKYSSNQSTPSSTPNPQTPIPTKAAPENQSPTLSSSKNAMKVEGTDFIPTYLISGGQVLGMKIDGESKSLVVSVQSTSDGIFTIKLDRELIDSKSPEGHDDLFFALVNGAEKNFQESKTTTDRTLTIPFSYGTDTIEIVGTQVTPEFGSMVSMIVAVSMVGVIAIHRKFLLK